MVTRLATPFEVTQLVVVDIDVYGEKKRLLPLRVVKKCVNYYQPTPEKHRGFVEGVRVADADRNIVP